MDRPWSLNFGRTVKALKQIMNSSQSNNDDGTQVFCFINIKEKYSYPVKYFRNHHDSSYSYFMMKQLYDYIRLSKVFKADRMFGMI